ncbi:heavy-metal-associated domain-containing protein [Sedimentibacter sp. B4]|uniref:heavy-metal-associated domain-containing protein n=1 Tax=Sedimentibacter sp. B4 TaxID=304766 RepID=UPI0002EBF120|nr:heavy-metal-associated domain-containing protein [Sedimentibacter sp. B4]
MKKVALQMEELVCPSCAKKIEGALKKTDGVNEVNILFNASKAKISFDETKTDVEKLSRIIQDLGFEVLSVK